MALHYILDGYNIIKSIDALADLALEDGRRELIRLVNTRCPQGSARNEVMIVFDGQPGVWGQPSPGALKVRFTSNGSADDYIKQTIERDADAKNAVVVSDDGEIACYVRKLGARVLSVQEFWASASGPRGARKGKRGASADGRPGKHITRVTQNAINRELKDFWIHKKGSSDGC